MIIRLYRYYSRHISYWAVCLRIGTFSGLIRLALVSLSLFNFDSSFLTRVSAHSSVKKRERNWSRTASRNCFWDCYWGRAGRLLADLATEQERHLTTGKRAERTKLDFRCPICRSAIGQAGGLICARSRQLTFPLCC